jgi:hypothetical protein
VLSLPPEKRAATRIEKLLRPWALRLDSA